MKIAIYDPYLDSLGGGEKYMMTAAEALSKKHEVTIIWNSESDIEKVSERFGLDLDSTKRADNIFTPEISFIQRWRETKKYDVLLYLSDGSIPVVGSKKLLVHLQFPVEWVNLDIKTRLKLSRVHKIIVNSQFTKKFIDNKLKVDSTLIYPPVTIQDQPMTKENIILHVGRFMKTGVEGSDYKKQYFMIETFKKMVEDGLKGWKFIIAASVRMKDLADFQKMQATAAGYPISFVVNAINADLWKLYGSARVYWHASGYGEDLEKNPERAEHFGISTVEAMSGGAIPVVINAGGQKEIIEDGINGLLWNTQDECIQKTKELITNTTTENTLRKNGITSAKKFDSSVFGTEIEKIVQS